MSLNNSIAVLAATAPPRSKPIFSVNKCNERIHTLEAQLGLPTGKDIFRIGLANARVRELEAKVAVASGSARGRTGLVVPASYAADRDLAVAAAPGISPTTLTALCSAVYGVDAASDFEAQRKQLTESGLTVPGLEPAPANRHFTPSFVGLARSVRADRQQKIDNFFRK